MKGSEDHDVGRYRYWSWRAWDAALPTLGWLLLRPSEVRNSTLSRVMNWSYRNGYGSISVCYLFAARTSHFHLLMAMRDPVGPECDDHIFNHMGEVNSFVCAWTDYGLKRGRIHSLLADPRWDSIRHKAYALKISRNHQPSFSNFFLGGAWFPFRPPGCQTDCLSL